MGGKREGVNRLEGRGKRFKECGGEKVGDGQNKVCARIVVKEIESCS